MRKDYHMHPRAIERSETFDAFVSTALGKKITEICVTDHMPLSISHVADRIPAGEVRNYCKTVRELAKRYEGILSIKCGIEIDYHPSVSDEIRAVLEEGDFDYVLGSSHMHIFVKDHPRYSFNDFASLAIENSQRAAESGWFDTIAHFDMYRFVFDNPKRFPLVDLEYDVFAHENDIKCVLDMIAKNNMLLEINPHLAESKKDITQTYPSEDIVLWALERNVNFSYGSDAHKSSSVGALLDELESHPIYKQALFNWENNSTDENNK